MNHFIDIHCHPTIKIWLFDKSLSAKAKPPDDVEPFDLFNVDNLYVSVPRMISGNVSMVWASHYLPEIGLIKNAKVDPIIKSILFSSFKKQISRFENNKTPDEPFKQLNKMISQFEEEVKKNNAICPHSKSEMNQALDSKRKVFLQSIEGGHHLGRGHKKKNGQPDIVKYISNLQKIFDIGVCSITLGHFFPNDLVSTVNGLPPNVISLLNYPTTFPDNGLSPVGEEVVRWMIKNGMIVDLIHSSPKTRKQIIAINNEDPNCRPLIFSHCGVAEIFKLHAQSKYLRDNVLNPSDEEIKAINKCNGIIGLIFNLYWLRGKEEDNTLFGLKPDEDGIPYIIESIKHIHKVTGTYDNIAIGTDFDGFTDVIDDAPDISFLPKIKDELQKQKISSNNIDKIMGKNALRVLNDGWGK